MHGEIKAEDNMMAEEAQGKSLPHQMKETAVDVRNEAIVQTANLYLLARKVFLASLGAMAYTADEASAVLERLVERGELAESDMQRLLKEFRVQSERTIEATEKVSTDVRKRAENVLDESVESILGKLDVPSKEDVDALSKKIGDLTNKVSALSEREKKVA